MTETTHENKIAPHRMQATRSYTNLLADVAATAHMFPVKPPLPPRPTERTWSPLYLRFLSVAFWFQKASGDAAFTIPCRIWAVELRAHEVDISQCRQWALNDSWLQHSPTPRSARRLEFRFTLTAFALNSQFVPAGRKRANMTDPKTTTTPTAPTVATLTEAATTATTAYEQTSNAAFESGTGVTKDDIAQEGFYMTTTDTQATAPDLGLEETAAATNAIYTAASDRLAALKARAVELSSTNSNRLRLRSALLVKLASGDKSASQDLDLFEVARTASVRESEGVSELIVIATEELKAAEADSLISNQAVEQYLRNKVIVRLKTEAETELATFREAFATASTSLAFFSDKLNGLALAGDQKSASELAATLLPGGANPLWLLTQASGARYVVGVQGWGAAWSFTMRPLRLMSEKGAALAGK